MDALRRFYGRLLDGIFLIKVAAVGTAILLYIAAEYFLQKLKDFAFENMEQNQLDWNAERVTKDTWI
jgi:hypothetical protein